jgi:predicted nuclease of predicted toxin-antitoxin system
VKIKIDEDLPRAVAVLLARAGHDPETVGQEGLGGSSDTRLWKKILKEGRLLITSDKGFGDIRFCPPGSNPGIILLRPSDDGVRPVLNLTKILLNSCNLEELQGCTTVVTPHGIRIRRS